MQVFIVNIVERMVQHKGVIKPKNGHEVRTVVGRHFNVKENVIFNEVLLLERKI